MCQCQARIQECVCQVQEQGWCVCQARTQRWCVCQARVQGWSVYARLGYRYYVCARLEYRKLICKNYKTGMMCITRIFRSCIWILNDVCVYSMKKQGVTETRSNGIYACSKWTTHYKELQLYLIYLQLDVCINVYAVVKWLISLTRAVIYSFIHVICTF